MKNILIVGSSSGIGNALAKMLSDDSRVYGTYYTHVIEARENFSAHYLDVMAETNDFSFLPESLDGLVYCPGTIVLKPFSRTKAADFLDDYKLQVLGAVTCIQACLPQLKRSGNAAIVLFSTVAVKMGFTYHSIVSASKGAMEGLTRALAAELAPSIRVNCIAPSVTNTPLAGTLLNTAEKLEASVQRHPLKRIGTAEDIAGMAAYLLKVETKWITGQILPVDGGISSIK